MFTRSISKVPPHRDARVGFVGAVGPGSDRALEVLAERVVMIGDPGDCLTHGAGRGDPGPFRCRARTALAPTESDGPREFAEQEVALRVGLRLPLGVPYGTGVLDVFVDLGEPP